MSPIDLSTNIGRLQLRNPVLNASGTWGLGSQEKSEDFRPGALVTKGITPKIRQGNPTPRLAESTNSLLNSIGLENSGVWKFVREELPEWKKYGVPVIVNVSGATIEDYVEVAQQLETAGVIAIEVNISCPNVKQGGMVFGVDPVASAEVVRAVRKVFTGTIIVKLTPNVTDIGLIAKTVVEAGADAISAVNTFAGMMIDIRTRKPKLGGNTGGLSGPAILPLAVLKVRQVCQVVTVPVIGMGGITTAEDAIQFFLAGATAVAVGTANFTNPEAMANITAGIARYLEDQGHRSIADIIGTLQMNKCP